MEEHSCIGSSLDFQDSFHYFYQIEASLLPAEDTKGRTNKRQLS